MGVRADKGGEAAARPTSTRRMAVLLVVVATTFLVPFTGSSVNLAVPAISEQFQSGATITGWIVTGYVLAMASCSVPLGRIADLTSRRLVLVVGSFVFTLCAGACMLSWSMSSFIAFRALQGIGAAMVVSTNMAILVETFPPQMRGRVLGFTVAATYVGLSAGPVLGGALNYYFGWHSIFVFTFVLGVVFSVIALRTLLRKPEQAEQPEKPEQAEQLEKRKAPLKVEQFDILGNLLYIGTILCVMYGFSAFAEGLFAKLLIPVGIILAVVFVRHELRDSSPVLEVRLFTRNVRYSFANIASLLNYSATSALGYFMSIVLQVIMGFSSGVAGIILISQPLFMAIVSPFAGRLSDRVSPAKLATLGMGLCAAGLFSFVIMFILGSFSLVHIIINLVVVGLGFGLFSSPNTNAIMSEVSAEDYGVATSILATMRSFGQAASMAVATLILSAYVGATPFSQAPTGLLAQAMCAGFAVFTVACIVGVAFSLQRRERKPRG